MASEVEQDSRSGGSLSRAQRVASCIPRSRLMPSATAPRTICASCLPKRVGISGSCELTTLPW
jgi:hypothetical protein